MSNNVMQTLHMTAFGELSTAEFTPEVQISAVNGLREDVQQITSGTGSSVSVNDNNYEVTSGTDAAGLSSILSQRFGTYRNGQGLLARFTALFPSNQPNSIQLAGIINGSNAFAFGYDGTSYGLCRAYGGRLELQRLQVTTPAAGAENATITVNGTAYVVPLTAGTVEHNAYEIAVSLQSQVSNYDVTSNGDSVTALSATPGPQGAFAFSSATAVAAWSQVQAGVTPTFDWVPLANWSNPPSWTIDPTKGNVYQIQVQYLGYGGIRFHMENPETTQLELVHLYEYTNANTTPIVNDPSFRVGWVVQNTGNTTSITTKGASAVIGVEGKKVFDERGRPLSAEVAALGTTNINLLTLRNRSHMDDHVNRVTVYPRLLVLGAAHNKTVVFTLSIDPTITGDLIFQYKDETNSVIEFATDAATVALDGREVLTVRVRSTDSVLINMRDALDLLRPREALTISAHTSSGTGAEADVSITWNEDP